MEFQNHVFIEPNGDEGYVTLCPPCSERVDKNMGEEGPEGEGLIEPMPFAASIDYGICDVCDRQM
jgi:hypothetical protein